MGRQSIAALLALGVVGAAHSAEPPGQLGYFVGYNVAIFQLENGRSFCVTSEQKSSLLAATRAETAPLDLKKPAPGLVARLAKAFPCPEGDRDVTIFSSKQVAKALLEQELTDADLENEDFRARHSVGLIVATNDLQDGKAYCLDTSNKSLSEALLDQQKRTPNALLSATFVLDALKAGFPCPR